MKKKIIAQEITEEILKVVGGTVGRFITEDYPGKMIGIQFKLKDGTRTPVYELKPWDARYAGWNLLRRGIVDCLKYWIMDKRNHI